MKILIIEDEFPCFMHLSTMLNDYGNVIIEGPLKSVGSVKNYFEDNCLDIDLIVSDIRLPDGLVFEALSTLNCEIPIIFTTAYGDYALNAFKYNSIDYLLKPVKGEELFTALEKLTKKKMEVSKLSTISEFIAQDYRRRFLCPYKDTMVVVLVDNISHITTENKHTKIYMTDGHSYHIDNSLEELMTQLNPNDFIRINRQYILSKQAIKSYSVGWNRKITINLLFFPKIQLEVGKEKLCILKGWLSK